MAKPKEGIYTLTEGLWQFLRTTFRLLVYKITFCRYERWYLVFVVSTKHILMVVCKSLGGWFIGKHTF
jgi:hypothetical protein